jgi:hypothetical protein
MSATDELLSILHKVTVKERDEARLQVAQLEETTRLLSADRPLQSIRKVADMIVNLRADLKMANHLADTFQAANMETAEQRDNLHDWLEHLHRGRSDLPEWAALSVEDALSGEKYEAPLAATPCRRCSECRGENHHWLEASYLPPPQGDGFNGYECKHCDARTEMCDGCGGADEPGHVCEDDEGGDGTTQHKSAANSRNDSERNER